MDMEFVFNVCTALHVSWYVMVVVTLLPMVVLISRSFALLYLIIYAFVCAWVVTCSVYDDAKSSSFLSAEVACLKSNVDEKVFIFRKIKLQDA
jgi:hypothetical protein